MNRGKLFLSFWNICLDNLPLGQFTDRQLTPDDARLRIEQTRQEGRLLCASDDDLLDPYRKRERNNLASLTPSSAAFASTSSRRRENLSVTDCGSPASVKLLPPFTVA